jgi:hypothetical protein
MGRFLREAVVPTWREAYAKTIVQVCAILLSVEKEMTVTVGHCPWPLKEKLVMFP